MTLQTIDTALGTETILPEFYAPLTVEQVTELRDALNEVLAAEA